MKYRTSDKKTEVCQKRNQ